VRRLTSLVLSLPLTKARGLARHPDAADTAEAIELRAIGVNKETKVRACQSAGIRGDADSCKQG
jgi:hypothetical protein